MTTKRERKPKPSTVVEYDLKRVVTAARYGRLVETVGGKIIEKVPTLDGSTTNFRRESPTREAVRLELLVLGSDGVYEPTEAGIARFGLPAMT